MDELRKLAQEGKLKVQKTKWRIVSRDKGWRGQKWDDQTNPSWSTEQIKYQTYHYEARTPDMPENQFYKITKKDYEELLPLC